MDCRMAKKHTEEQILAALHQVEGGEKIRTCAASWG